MQPTLAPITVETSVKAGVEKVWNYWSRPEHIKAWCSGHPDWHVPAADNDLSIGGKFNTVMAAKDGSMSFNFAGEYTNVIEHKLIEYTLEDGRKVTVTFAPNESETKIVETFDPETQNPVEFQREGWNNILINFKNYTEAN